MTNTASERDLVMLTKKEAVEFWQREVHYYERRAGEQGVMANRIVTLAVALAAAIPVALTTLPKSTPVVQTLIALGIPAVILLLLANAVRLLHEMERLRRYVQHAEAELIRVGGDDDALRAYRRWADIGGKKDFPVVLTAVLAILILFISLVAIVSLTGAIVNDANPWSPLIVAGTIGVAVLLIGGYISVFVHARTVQKLLAASRTTPAAAATEDGEAKPATFDSA